MYAGNIYIYIYMCVCVCVCVCVYCIVAEHFLFITLAIYMCLLYCSQTFLAYLFIMFACISYGRFIAIRCKFKLSTYAQEPLAIGRRGYVQTQI